MYTLHCLFIENLLIASQKTVLLLRFETDRRSLVLLLLSTDYAYVVIHFETTELKINAPIYTQLGTLVRALADFHASFIDIPITTLLKRYSKAKSKAPAHSRALYRVRRVVRRASLCEGEHVDRRSILILVHLRT